MRTSLYHLMLCNADFELLEIKSRKKLLYVVKITEKVSHIEEDKEVKITEFLNNTFRQSLERFTHEVYIRLENDMLQTISPLPF